MRQTPQGNTMKLYLCKCSHQELSLNTPNHCPNCPLPEYHEVQEIPGGCLEEIACIPGFPVPVKIKYNIEAIQDVHFINSELKSGRMLLPEPTPEEIAMWEQLSTENALMGKIRTDEPTEQEIKDWNYYHQLFQNIKSTDFDKIKQKYQIKFSDNNYWRNQDQLWESDTLCKESIIGFPDTSAANVNAYIPYSIEIKFNQRIQQWETEDDWGIEGLKEFMNVVNQFPNQAHQFFML